MIYLVRHAQAATRAAWPGSDGARPLSPQGCRQAAGLVTLLGSRPITRILSSPRERCLATVAPLAEARRLQVELEPRLDEAAPPGEADLFLEAPVEGTVLCTHRPVIAALLGSLAASGLALPGASEVAPGSVWELTIADGRLVSGRYLPPAG